MSLLKTLKISQIRRKEQFLKSDRVPYSREEWGWVRETQRKSGIETITLRWMREEGLPPEAARAMAIEEMDFYSDEKPTWKGPNDSTQDFI